MLLTEELHANRTSVPPGYTFSYGTGDIVFSFFSIYKPLQTVVSDRLPANILYMLQDSTDVASSRATSLQGPIK